MSHTGSLQNSLYDAATGDVTPEVGMGATIIQWTDRTACTIVAVSKSGHQIKLQADHAKRTDSNGMSDTQEYAYSPNPDGIIRVAFRRNDGSYRLSGGGSRVLLNVRRHYHDFSF